MEFHSTDHEIRVRYQLYFQLFSRYQVKNILVNVYTDLQANIKLFLLHA